MAATPTCGAMLTLPISFSTNNISHEGFSYQQELVGNEVFPTDLESFPTNLAVEKSVFLVVIDVEDDRTPNVLV